MSTSNTVIIPTAGTGSRMGKYTRYLNKSLLPYQGKPVLSHIIDSFPTDTRFIIPVGYLADQVKDFCLLTYPNRQIEFVEIQDYTSSASGAGRTFEQCKDSINGPFWYITCDTYFNENILDKVNDNDCCFTKTVPEDESYLYTMFEVDNNKITDITFKQTQPTSWAAFTGVMYIYHWERFFNNLKTINSAEFIYSISCGSDVAPLDTWKDFGCPVSYHNAVSKSLAFDFSKEDEVTYICNNKVIKWWVDPEVAKKKYTKTLSNKSVFPENCQYRGNYMSYDFFPGKTLYEHNDASTISNLLTWLDDNVWIHYDNDIRAEASTFYKDKTLNRVNQFLKKHTSLPVIKSIDGVKVKDYSYYLENINWDELSNDNLTGFIHGDLQFDNIIINDNNEFKIIDWRHEFGGLIEYGDIYYDLAKMSGGLIINYARIKNHQFAIQIDRDAVTLDIPNIDDISKYQQEIKNYINKHNLNYKKVQQLVPIIFWNMSPLHFEPFDMFLWYLGIKLFQELENENIH